MAEFIRARSSEQKQLRMNEIMTVTDQLFSEQTYHAITLTTIAESLGWSRGNLYKYVTTKEEIFLELYLEKQQNYFQDLEEAFSNQTGLTNEEFVKIWATTLDHHHDFLKYYGILATIIETNVTVERLAEFKRNVMTGIDDVVSILEKHCKNTHEEANELFWTLLFHATGLNNSCNMNPMVKEAMIMAGIPLRELDFIENFSKFMLMCLKEYSI